MYLSVDVIALYVCISAKSDAAITVGFKRKKDPKK